MSDLIEKFFKKDLTEAEKEALAKQLSSSDKAAQKFGEKAVETYRSFGLPEPRWTGPDTLRRAPGTSYWKWVALGLTLILLGGASTWVFHHSSNYPVNGTAITTPLPETKPAELASKPVPHKRKTVSASKRPPLAATPSASGEGNSVSPGQGTAKQGSTDVSSQAPVLTGPAPKLTPVNVDHNPDGTFSSLSVQLRVSSTRSVTVKVLDAKGEELLPLFNGALPAGNWAFEWNGLLKDGTLAQPGSYQIKVQSGSWSQTKEVLIQK